MYNGTTLVENPGIEEINRALLDLLKKINELSQEVDRIRKEYAANH